MTMTMIGYGRFQYTVRSSPVPVAWPILGLALHARISATGVVTIADLGEVDLPALAGMITAIEAGLAAGQLTPR